MQELSVAVAKTPEQRAAAMGIRRQVFIEEQGVPRALEVDDYEDQSEHFLCLAGGVPVGAGRLRLKKSYAKFERIATLKEWRGRGIGRKIMEFMQEHASRNYPRYLPAMHAQGNAVGFYEKLGWIAVGETFKEADIPHRIMVFPPAGRSGVEGLLAWSDPEARQDIRDLLRRLARP